MVVYNNHTMSPKYTVRMGKITREQTDLLFQFNNEIWNALQEGVGKYKFCIVDDLHKIINVLCSMEEHEIVDVKPQYQKLNAFCKSLFPQELKKLLEK